MRKAEWLLAKGYSGSVDDMFLKYMKANGATSSIRNDAEKQFLLSKGISLGPLNQMWYAYLGTLGYSGTLPDRFSQMYLNSNNLSYTDFTFNGTLPAPFNAINRGGLATQIGSTGLVEYGPHNLLDYNQDLSNAAWGRSTNVSATGGLIGPGGIVGVSRIDWAAAAEEAGIFKVASGVNGSANCKSVWVWADSAGGQISIADPAATAGETYHTLTTSPTRVVLSEAAGTQLSNGGLWIRKRAGAPASIYVWAPRFQLGADSGAADDALTLTTTATVFLPRITHDPSLATDGSTYTVSEVLGPELVANGGFATDSWWLKGANWAIAGGVAMHSTGAESYMLSPASTTVPGTKYKVSFEVVSLSGGNMLLAFGVGAFVTITAPGSYTRYLTANADARIGFQAGVGVSAAIANVSVREYTGTQIDGGKVPACLGMLVEGQATDTAQDTGLNVAVTAAQSLTVTATAWTVSFNGTGTVTLSGAHTATITGTGANIQTALTFTPSAGSLTMTPSGDVKNLDCVNQAYASSTIVNPTTGTAVRTADPIVLTGADFAARFGDGSDFVAVFDYTPLGGVGGTDVAFEFAGAFDRAVTTGVIRRAGTSCLFYGAGWLLQANLAAVSTSNVRQRFALAYTANRMRISMSGGAVQSDLSGTVTGPLGRLAIGGNTGAGERQNLMLHGYGGIPGAGSTMSDAELQALSTI